MIIKHHALKKKVTRHAQIKRIISILLRLLKPMIENTYLSCGSTEDNKGVIDQCSLVKHSLCTLHALKPKVGLTLFMLET